MEVSDGAMAQAGLSALTIAVWTELRVTANPKRPLMIERVNTRELIVSTQS
jgi:hypothetical protein